MKFLTPFLMLAAAVGLFLLFINPQYKSVTELRARALEYDNAIERAQAVVAKKDQLVSKYSAFNPADIQRLQKMLPGKIDTIQLILDLNGIAVGQGSQIQGIKVSADTTQKPTSVGASQSPYGVMLIGFNVSMTYENFQLFLKDLEKSLRIVDVASVSFTPANTTNTYDYSVVLKAYWLK